MIRLILSLSFATILAVAAAGLWAQQPKIPVVGVLMAISNPDDLIVNSFRQGLRDLGYVEGRNIRIEFRSALNHPERLPGLAEELVQLNVDVIFTVASSAIDAARKATSTIPIVIAIGGDPVRAGLVTSLAKPGGNITGLSSMSTAYSSKLLELLKETIPKLKRIAVLWNPETPPSPVDAKLVADLQSAASLLSIEMVFLRASTLKEIDQAFEKANRARVQAVYAVDNPLFYVERQALAMGATNSGLPAIYRTKVFADAGGLMSYGSNWSEQTRRAAGYVDRILKGAKPGDLPIEQPTKFELVVNLNAAKQLGITIPQSILQRADEVIR